MSAHLNSKHLNNIPRKFYLTLAVGVIFGFSFALFTWKGVNTSSRFLGPMIYYEVDQTVADDLYNQVRVLCWVITNPENHENRAKVVKDTWGNRCNVLLFISSEEDTDLPAIDVEETQLWPKTRNALSYIYEHYIDSIDWFLRADDETYIVVENLRYMLQFHNPDEPLYFGRKFTKYFEQGYMSGGAGYVLSREAVRRFVEIALYDPTICNTKRKGLDDVELGNCLGNVGVLAGESGDSLGRERFFPFQPQVHMINEYLVQVPWFFEYINNSNAQETDCCSQTTISFHNVFPEDMYIYNYFLYNLRSLPMIKM